MSQLRILSRFFSKPHLNSHPASNLSNVLMRSKISAQIYLPSASVFSSSSHQFPIHHYSTLSSSSSSFSPDSNLILSNKNVKNIHNIKRAAVLAATATSGAVYIRATSSVSAQAASESPSEISSVWKDKDIVLYQYEVCPYCNKVRAFLDFYNIPYRTVEVNPLSKKEIKFSEYKKVPVVLINGEQHNESGEIIQKLNKMIESNESYEMKEEEKKWFEWVDTRLIKILPPNIYRTVGESFQTFEYLTSISNFSAVQRESARYFGAGMMYFVSKKLKKKYNIDDEREALYEAVNSFIDAVGDKAFLGGNEPNLADIAVFGVLRSIENYDTFKDMITNSKVSPWYTRMTEKTGAPSRLTEASPVWG